jgi:hypothetical protein
VLAGTTVGGHAGCVSGRVLAAAATPQYPQLLPEWNKPLDSPGINPQFAAAAQILDARANSRVADRTWRMDVARAKRASPSPWTAEGRKAVCVSGIKPCREIVASRGVRSGSPESASATSAIVKEVLGIGVWHGLLGEAQKLQRILRSRG